jgi:hypothetical protein
MGTTTSKGYYKPATGERGFWDSLNSNTDRINDHTHDGSDSTVIPAKNIVKGTSTISSASWAATTGKAGTYEQTITVPSGYTNKTCSITFYIASGSNDGNIVFPSIVYVTSTTYKVYTNDNTVDYKAVYA